MPSATEMQLNKTVFVLNANSVLLNVWGGGAYIIGANQAENRASSLFNCISVTDDIHVN